MKADKQNSEFIDELLSRSVAEILPDKESLRKLLLSGKKLRIYIGTDPTGTSLHLGHATNYMILEKFRQLGHEVIFLIGDFTARIGDPTDKKDSVRKQLTKKQVVGNVKTWIAQIRPIINIDNKENPVRVLYNNDWLSKLNFEDVLNLSANFTVQQMLERDMFRERIESDKPLFLHELFYPLMQGYDSVAMDVDIEMCGTDQKFNALAGRTLLKRLKNKEKFVFITTLLENPKTGEKMMAKSLGTGVYLDWGPDEMFGGLMAQPDENIKQLFTDCTLVALDEIESILETEKPLNAKRRLAFEVVRIYHGKEKALKAQDNFTQTFQSGTPRFDKKVSANNLLELVVEASNVSASQAKRLIKDGAVAVNGEVIVDTKAAVKKGDEVKIGKKTFVTVA